MSLLSLPQFHNEVSAFAFLEGELWPNGPVCPHCGNTAKITRVKANPEKRIRNGLWRCPACKKQLRVTLGTVFEHARIPLHKVLQAVYLMCCSKKGISAHQLHRVLEVNYRTAWFLEHRIREAMAVDSASFGSLGGEGKFVEADTTFIGGKEKNKHASKRRRGNIGGTGKQIVHVLVERDGRARSEHVASVSGKTLRPVVMNHVRRESALMTDTAGGYIGMGKEFARHEMVDHGKGEYVRGDAHSNSAEAYFSLLKRGIIGTFHHISEAHLHRYLAEFDFRHNTRTKLGVDDENRTRFAVLGAKGKRLTYQGPSG